MSKPEATQAATSEPARSANRGNDVVVQIKVKLLGVSKPPVWRRLQLRADTRLDQLHQMIATGFGWTDTHLHVFTSGAEEFGLPDPELGHADERRASLRQLIGGVGDRLRYTYDFGDDWEHEIVVEALLDNEPETHYPVLVDAKGACPPEDCGGSWAYAELKAVLADPGHEQHRQMLDWLGLENASSFDPNAVPTDHIQRDLGRTGASR